MKNPELKITRIVSREQSGSGKKTLLMGIFVQGSEEDLRRDPHINADEIYCELVVEGQVRQTLKVSYPITFGMVNTVRLFSDSEISADLAGCVECPGVFLRINRDQC